MGLPNCGYLAECSIKVEQSQFIVSLTPKGYIDVCSLIEKAFPDVKCVVHKGRISLRSEHTIAISGSIPNPSELEQFLDLLGNCLTIDTSLDECHALSPHMLANEDDNLFRSKMGELVYRAKYQSDPTAVKKITASLIEFIEAHPKYVRAEFIVAAPPSERRRTVDLPRQLAKRVASSMGKKLVLAKKTRDTGPNKELLQYGDVSLLKKNVQDSIRIDETIPNSTILALDDLCGSGMTLEELGRACRAAGAIEVLGLVVTKDATLLQGGINLSEGPWHEQ